MNESLPEIEQSVTNFVPDIASAPNFTTRLVTISANRGDIVDLSSYLTGALSEDNTLFLPDDYNLTVNSVDYIKVNPQGVKVIQVAPQNRISPGINRIKTRGLKVYLPKNKGFYKLVEYNGGKIVYSTPATIKFIFMLASVYINPSDTAKLSNVELFYSFTINVTV